MYTLEIRPISEILAIADTNISKIAEYRTPPGLVGKPDLEQKFKDYMAATGQGWARWKGTLSDEERAQLSVPAGPPAAAAVQTPAQAIQALMQSVRQFGSQFNQEIQKYNEHIKKVHQSIAMLQKIDWSNSTVDPTTVVQQSKALQQTLDTATSEKAQDMAFLQQLATQAAQLAQSASGAGQSMEQAFNPAAPVAPAPAPAQGATGTSEQMGKGVGTALKAPGRALNWLGNQVGRGVDWTRQQGNQFGRGYSGAESNQLILTARMGSAQSLLKYPTIKVGISHS